MAGVRMRFRLPVRLTTRRVAWAALCTAVLAPSWLPADAWADDHGDATGVLDGTRVGWDASARVLAYRDCWREEGGGKGCAVRFKHLRSGVTEDVPIHEVGEADEPAAQAEAEPRVRSRLEAGAFRFLPSTPWPHAARDLELPDAPVTLHWNGRTLRATGDVLAKPVSVRVRQVRPWRARPECLYAAPNEPVVVVMFVHDPGEAYLSGLNIRTVPQVLELGSIARPQGGRKPRRHTKNAGSGPMGNISPRRPAHPGGHARRTADGPARVVEILQPVNRAT